MRHLALTAGEEGARPFMQRLLAEYNVTWAAEDMDGALVESESSDTEHKLQPPSRTVVELSPEMKGEIEL